MSYSMSTLRDQVILAALPEVSQNGWTPAAIDRAAQACGVQDDITLSLFPNGMVDAVAHFSDYIDREMMKRIEKIPAASLRSKDKVRAAVMARYDVLAPYKEVTEFALAFWSVPTHVIQGQRVLWRTSDRIWTWAGDTATDYNRQTKRALLSSIMMGTTMVWIGDDSENHIITQAFLDRRLENIMEFGRAIGTMKKVIPNLFRNANQSK